MFHDIFDHILQIFAPFCNLKLQFHHPSETKSFKLTRVVLGVKLFSYIPWKDSLSGEVGGYPQALPEVVTLMEC